MASLEEELHSRRVAAVEADAVFIREKPDSPEKSAAALWQIGQVMYACAIGRLTQEEKNRLLSILSECLRDSLN